MCLQITFKFKSLIITMYDNEAGMHPFFHRRSYVERSSSGRFICTGLATHTTANQLHTAASIGERPYACTDTRVVAGSGEQLAARERQRRNLPHERVDNIER
jgi:hypothetical protein